MLPSPTGVNVTVALLTGFVNASVTKTCGAVASAAPATALCLSPPATRTLAGAPATAVAEYVNGARLPATTVNCCVDDAILPSVQVVAATPSLPVVTVVDATLPPPDAMVNVTP